MGAVHRNEDEVLEEHVSNLGPELGRVYHSIWQQCAWLRVVWTQYVELFGGPKEYVDVLNQASGLFFHTAQRAILDEVLLCLCRLTDPIATAGKPNLSLDALADAIADPKLKAEVEQHVKTAKKATEFARERRNKLISHMDREHALGTQVTALPLPSREQLEGAIEAVEGVAKAVAAKALGAVLHEDVIMPPGSRAEVLIEILRLGIKARHAERAKRRAKGPQ